MSCSMYPSGHHEGGVGDRTTRASSSSTHPPKQNYEVFLSFRGDDTRLGFTDHLYHGLFNRGIKVFRDSEELYVGEKIDQLFEAIKASKISIPIISPDYSSSIWCLKELLQILECKKTSGQLVLPIFYHVKPSDVREQKGNFGEKFQLCKRKHHLDGKFVQELENAFKEVAILKGWEAGGHEGELVKMVVTEIFNELSKTVLFVPGFLVGVRNHVKEIETMIDAGPANEAKIIAIHGMGGIGKTTLAKVLYNALSNNFDCHSFVPNIREASKNKGMEALQKQMISDILMDKSPREISHVDEGRNIIKKRFRGKRLLLLLDDVEDKDQLNKLAVENNFFGSGSIVIITTRNKDVTVASAVNLSYELNELNDDQSYELFCKHAFGRDELCPRYLETISRNIISTTGGLPLAIEVIGSWLYQKDEDIWKEALEKLRRIPNEKVRDKLKISYDSLEHRQQQIFLDIACLPVTNYLLEYFSWMWKSCGFYPEEGIERLISLSLIKVANGVVIIHDQLRDLGREIVREQGCDNIGCSSRLWLDEEAIEVIERKQGTSNVQALLIEHTRMDRKTFSSQQFEGMTNLRFLQMYNVHLIGDFENHFLNLRWFRWRGQFDHSKIDIMGINFNPKKLVVLDLFCSNITKYWKGWRQMQFLKILHLVDCMRLTMTPDFSMMEGLEVLALDSCTKLRRIHPSIGKLSKTLKFLEIQWCRKLENLPIEMGKMEELRELNICNTSIREIPIFEGYMKKLETLDASGCDKLISVPDSIGSLVKLQRFNLRRCKSLTKIPESIGKLKSLVELCLAETGVEKLPHSIGELCDLEILGLSMVPIKYLPTSIGMLTKLSDLDLSYCKKLKSLPNIPCLTALVLHGDSMDALPDFSNLFKLKKLDYRDLFEKKNRALYLGNVNHLETLSIEHTLMWDDFGQDDISDKELENVSLQLVLPVSLVKLEIGRCQTLRTLPNLSNLKNLSCLNLYECSEMREVHGLEGAESLKRLGIVGCRKLSRLGDLSHLKMLRELHLLDCEKLSDVQGIEKLTSLTSLSISECHLDFSVISMLRNLKDLTIKDKKLIEIPGLQELKSLETLDISGCKSLRYLPSLSQLTILEIVYAQGCQQLAAIQGIESLTSLRKLDIRGCTKLGNLPHLPEVDVRSSHGSLVNLKGLLCCSGRLSC